MTCQTCKGCGHVAGHWMPEICPACNGGGEVRLHADKPDTTIPWGLLIVFAVAFAVVAIAQWGLWSLILPAVFAA